MRGSDGAGQGRVSESQEPPDLVLPLHLWAEAANTQDWWLRFIDFEPRPHVGQMKNACLKIDVPS